MPQPNEKLVSAIYAVFVPLASMLLRYGLTAAPVINLLRTAFADAAHRELGKSGKPASINRVAQLTGFSRKHVGSLLEQAGEIPPPHSLGAPIESAILTTWTSSERFVDELGQPRVLEIGPGPGTFTELVKIATGEDAVLKYLSRLSQAESVSVLEDERIRMVQRNFTVLDDLPRMIALMLVPAITTISRNWGAEPEARHCIRVTHSNRVDPAKVGILRRVSKERITRFLEDMDDLICTTEAESGTHHTGADGDALVHLGVGAYYFELER